LTVNQTVKAIDANEGDVMSRPTIGIAGWKKRTLKRLSLVAIAGALILPALVGAQTPPPQATGISFFKNYTITGDYQVAGVNLRGTGDSTDMATGIINSSGTEFTMPT